MGIVNLAKSEYLHFGIVILCQIKIVPCCISSFMPNCNMSMEVYLFYFKLDYFIVGIVISVKLEYVIVGLIMKCKINK